MDKSSYWLSLLLGQPQQKCLKGSQTLSYTKPIHGQTAGAHERNSSYGEPALTRYLLRAIGSFKMLSSTMDTDKLSENGIYNAISPDQVRFFFRNTHDDDSHDQKNHLSDVEQLQSQDRPDNYGTLASGEFTRTCILQNVKTGDWMKFVIWWQRNRLDVDAAEPLNHVSKHLMARSWSPLNRQSRDVEGAHWSLQNLHTQQNMANRLHLRALPTKAIEKEEEIKDLLKCALNRDIQQNRRKAEQACPIGWTWRVQWSLAQKVFSQTAYRLTQGGCPLGHGQGVTNHTCNSHITAKDWLTVHATAT